MDKEEIYVANFHSNEWIMDRVGEHDNEAKTIIPSSFIFGTFYQGSGNYGLDCVSSDVDTKVITIPSLDAICFNKKPLSTTHIRENNEHIDLKDIRLYFQCFRKQNINFLEILFTDYALINPLFATEYLELVAHNEEIAHYDVLSAAATIKGMAMEKYHALKHPYPSKAEVLATFGYDPKQLHHLARFTTFATDYLSGQSYQDCLHAADAEHLIAIKQGYYSLEKAEQLAEQSLLFIVNLIDSFREKYADMPINQEVDDLLNNVQSKIIKKSIKRELQEEGNI